jgi:hypothetical protein
MGLQELLLLLVLMRVRLLLLFLRGTEAASGSAAGSAQGPCWAAGLQLLLLSGSFVPQQAGCQHCAEQLCVHEKQQATQVRTIHAELNASNCTHCTPGCACR